MKAAVELLEWTGQTWNEFWFNPSPAERLNALRWGVCSLAFLWFMVQCVDVEAWYGSSGWLESKLARQVMVASDGSWLSRFRISPLWALSTPAAVRLWAASGLVLSILVGMRRGGRAVALVLWLCFLALVHRSAWATGAFEPFLAACLSYLVIDAGRFENSVFKTKATDPGPSLSPMDDRWSTTLATRLFQVHLFLLIAFQLGSQLSAACWWRGDAVWWLAVTGQSHLLSTDMLRGHVLLVNALTHAIVLCGILAIATLWHARLRIVGVVAACLVGLAYAFIADQFLYGALQICIATFAFRPRPAVAPI